ncbi:MAG TPA: hypothetical protein VLD62_07290 [Acidimicrobiia bacterium]|nr:hypothetical protein [Acidimicrobiia bacterium]
MPKIATGIGRTIDLRYPSNVFIAVATVVGGAIAFFPTLGDGFAEAFVAGARAGGGTFLGWAIARELDPDRPWSAGVAAVLAFVVSFIGDPMLAVAGVALLASRIAVRSTGLHPTPVDLLVVIGAAAYAATRTGGFPVAVVLGLSLVVDGRLPGGSKRRVAIAGYGVLGAAVTSAAVAGNLVPDPTAAAGWDWLLVAVAVVGSVLVLRPPNVTSRSDWTDRPLEARRLRASRIVALGVVAGSAVWAGGEGLAAAAPVAAAMAGSLLPQPSQRAVPESARA